MDVSTNNLPNYMQKNLAAFGDRQKRLRAVVEHEPSFRDVDRVTPCIAKSGAVSAKCGSVSLHSTYDPQREAERFIASQHLTPDSIVIVYGFGLGYHIKALLDSVGSRARVFVLELNAAILRAAFTLVDCSDMIRDERLSIVCSDTQEAVALHFLSVVNKVLDAADDMPQHVVIHDPSFKCVPPGFENIQNTFEMLQLERRAPDVFEDINIINMKRNVDAVLENPGLSHYRQRYQGKPAFFVNAGPSLDEMISVVREYKDNAIVFCCDTAYPALMDQGVVPDFVFSIDPQTDSERHFARHYDASATLVFLPTSAAEVVARYTGPKMVLLQKGHSLTKRFEKELAYKGWTMAGGSVSCIGLDVLLQLGCSPVLFVGMDYAYSNGKFYSGNVAATKGWTQQCWRLDTAESRHWKTIHSGEKVVFTKDTYGNPIPTSQTLYAYLKQIERLIEENPETQFYNAFSRGAQIRGTEDLVLREELSMLLPHRINKYVEIPDTAVDKKLKEYIMQGLAGGRKEGDV